MNAKYVNLQQISILTTIMLGVTASGYHNKSTVLKKRCVNKLNKPTCNTCMGNFQYE